MEVIGFLVLILWCMASTNKAMGWCITVLRQYSIYITLNHLRCTLRTQDPEVMWTRIMTLLFQGEDLLNMVVILTIPEEVGLILGLADLPFYPKVHMDRIQDIMLVQEMSLRITVTIMECHLIYMYLMTVGITLLHQMLVEFLLLHSTVRAIRHII